MKKMIPWQGVQGHLLYGIKEVNDDNGKTQYNLE
jgi:hypothetical protein